VAGHYVLGGRRRYLLQQARDIALVGTHIAPRLFSDVPFSIMHISISSKASKPYRKSYVNKAVPRRPVKVKRTGEGGRKSGDVEGAGSGSLEERRGGVCSEQFFLRIDHYVYMYSASGSDVAGRDRRAMAAVCALFLCNDDILAIGFWYRRRGSFCASVNRSLFRYAASAAR